MLLIEYDYFTKVLENYIKKKDKLTIKTACNEFGGITLWWISIAGSRLDV